MTLIPAKADDKIPARLPIPKLTQLTAPSKLVFLAIHTQKVKVSPSQYKRVLVSGYAIYWRREKSKSKELLDSFEFCNSYDFFEWLVSKVNKRETLYLYSHDVTTDFLALDGFRQLPVHDFVMQSIYHKLTTTIIKFSNDTRRITILDTQNYYPIKLDKLSRSFRRDISIELEDNASPECIKEWCKNKAGFLKEILEQLINETVVSKRGSLKMTASSTSHSIYRATYMKHKIITNHDPEIVAFERSSYVGGYTAINKLVQTGEPELYKLDVNSMYPSVMLEKKYPTHLVDFAGGVNIHHIERFLEKYLVIANVTLSARAGHYPYKMNELSYYPLGEFDTTLSTQSLKKALENDEIVKVNHVAVYQGQPLFAEFVTDVYNRRMQAREDNNPAEEMLQKNINNVLYGKFGQLQTETIRVGDAPMDEFCVMDAFSPSDNTSWIEMHAGGSVLFIHKKNETRYTSFAIAAHVTDYARQKLFALKDKAGVNNVYYMDTDSLIVNKEGLNNLKADIHQSMIGKLKVEEMAEFFIGFAKKDYVFGGTRKLKGFDPDGKRTEGNVFKSFERASITGSMKVSLSGAPFWKEVNKHYSPFIDSGHIQADGSIKPSRLPDDNKTLGLRQHTIRKVKELARRVLNDAQRNEVGEWLNL